jgi:alpha-glucuronidase
MKRFLVALAVLLFPSLAHADDGYELWLRYHPMEVSAVAQYAPSATVVVANGNSETIRAAADELTRGLSGLLGKPVATANTVQDGAVVLGTPATSPLVKSLNLSKLNDEGYLIETTTSDGHKVTMIAGKTDAGVLYGAFAFLKLIQTRQSIASLDLSSSPRLKVRIMDHWDNLNGTIERGYAGFSIWDWQKMPDWMDTRYTDYARAEASIGVNGVNVNNVGAQPEILTATYIRRLAALAAVFRPYHIRVYVSARFSAPIEVGGLKTADPTDPAVAKWWKYKADEIYAAIPDFGGFLVKANSEGQPGPQDYHRTQADGANVMADALKPHGGIVMWRAFIYSAENAQDRAMQAYSELHPLDGKFRDNVIVQAKNGAIDFQPREPFHPLFGAMPHTGMFLEVQLTREYLGLATSLAYLAPLYEEVLHADTFAKGPGSTVERVIDGSLFGNTLTGMAGVSNIGTDRDWSGSTFNQANWYAFGRLAWDPAASSRTIAEDWVKMTFTADPKFVAPVVDMMMASREAVVDYMTPLGLAHLMATGHHYGPGPWVSDLKRPEWNPVYYHHADAAGLGFDRTPTGSNATSQYAPAAAAEFNDLNRIPEKFLLWFHHVPWTYKMKSGRTLWDELVVHWDDGVAATARAEETWAGMKGYVDAERYAKTAAYLKIEHHEAQWWRDAMVAYFSTFSKLPLPAGHAPAPHDLQYYKDIQFKYVPGRAISDP